MGKERIDVMEVDEKLELLPGLPDELAIDQIITKVPWTSLYSLSTVSRAWYVAIFERRFHNARVRASSTQTYVVIIHEAPPSSNRLGDTVEEQDDPDLARFPLAISLYDPGMDAWRLLPSVKSMAEGIPHGCECVCVQGKVYILGGMGKSRCPRKEMYMLDLAAGRERWLKCASMQRERVRFSCSVKDSKIFAIAGTSNDREVLEEAEVYDTEQNVWSLIAPMRHRHTEHKVAFSQGEFYVHGGLYWKEIVSTDDKAESEDLDCPYLRDAKFAEIFDPCKNRWRQVDDFKRGMQGPIVEVGGKLVNLSMSINHNSVEIYSGHSNSWISSQPISWKISEHGKPRAFFRWPMYVLYQAIGLAEEVLAWLFSVEYIEKWQRNYLLRSKGLGSTGCSLEWEKMASVNEFPKRILCMRRMEL